MVFGDLESVNVRTFVLWLLPDIIREWVRTNIVQIQYRSFMTASLPYPNVFVSQQAAALAAGVQDRLWNFIDTFYHEQGKEHTRYVTGAYLNEIARQIPGLAPNGKTTTNPSINWRHCHVATTITQIAAGSTVAKIVAGYDFKNGAEKGQVSCKEEYTWKKQNPGKAFKFTPSYEKNVCIH